MKKMKKIIVLQIACLVCLWSFSQTDIITIDPDNVKQTVFYGGDAKLTIKAYAEGNVNTVSQKLFGDMNLQMFRVPIFALQPITDPIYDNVITVINAIKSVNPNVKIFASIANGDGYGVNHHGKDKFPASWRGCCAYNVYSLNLTTYSAYLDSFMDRMSAAGITIDYLGPWNEDPADDSDHVKIRDQMTKLGATKMVGVERWALQSSINDVDDIEDRVEIVGSHFYDDDQIAESNWDAKWTELVNKSADPVWYTEATRYKNNDDFINLINGLNNIFPAIRGGVENVTFYQVCKRFVYANGGTLPTKYSGFKNLVNNSEGNVINSTSNNSNIKVIAFGHGNTLDVHIINYNTSNKTVNLQLQNAFLGNGTVDKKIWISGTNGQQSSSNVNNSANWDIDIPATSYTHLKIPLNKPILDIEDHTLPSKNIRVFPNPVKHGNINIKMPKTIKSKMVNIKLFTVNGQEVLSEIVNYDPNIKISKMLAPGIYFLNVGVENMQFKNKIVIQN